MIDWELIIWGIIVVSGIGLVATLVSGFFELKTLRERMKIEEQMYLEFAKARAATFGFDVEKFRSDKNKNVS